MRVRMSASSMTYSAVPCSRASSTISTPPTYRWSSFTSAVKGSTAPSSMVVRLSGCLLKSAAGRDMRFLSCVLGIRLVYHPRSRTATP